MEPKRLTIQTILSILSFDDVARARKELLKGIWCVIIPRYGTLYNDRNKVFVSAPTMESAAIKVFRRDYLSFAGLISDGYPIRIRAGNQILYKVDGGIARDLYPGGFPLEQIDDLSMLKLKGNISSEVISDEQLLSHIKNSWWGKNWEKWIKPFSEVGMIE